MRIAYLYENPLPAKTAHAVLVLALSDALAQLGHEVFILHPGPGGLAEPSVAHDFGLHRAPRFVHVPTLSVAGRLRGSYFSSAALVARAMRVELALAENPRAARAAVRFGTRALLDSHSLAGSSRQLRALAGFLASSRAAGWSFNTDRLRRDYAGLGFASPRSVVAPCAVDLARFTPARSRAEARARLGIAQDARLVVHAGSLYPGRGAELLLEAASRVAGASVRFVGGTPEDVARLEARARRTPALGVSFRGHLPVSELPDELFAASVLVAPYTSAATAVGGQGRTIDYASPMKLFEYLAAGRPIVSSRFDGIAEVLTDEHDALLVPPDDAAALAVALARALDDDALSDRLGAAARRSAERHTWRLRAEALLALAAEERRA